MVQASIPRDLIKKLLDPIKSAVPPSKSRRIANINNPDFLLLKTFGDTVIGTPPLRHWSGQIPVQPNPRVSDQGSIIEILAGGPHLDSGM